MMIRRLLRCLAPLAVLVLCAANTAPDSEGPADRVPVLSYALAGLFTLAVLVIICMPSRKT